MTWINQARRSPAAILALAALLLACVAVAIALSGNAAARGGGSPELKIKQANEAGTALANNAENVGVNCKKSSYQSIAGGVSSAQNKDVVTYESVKNGKTGWNVGVFNGTGAPVNFNAFVVCAKIK